MEVFEVHITGDESIHEVGKKNGYKTIAIELLRPDGSVIRVEHMTSMVVKFENYAKCKSYVDNVVAFLKEAGVKLWRVKIESPYYEHYRDQSLYMESHFESAEFKFPTSRNMKKTEVYLATDREWNPAEFDRFRERYVGCDVELALYDTMPTEDADWLGLYNTKS